LRDTAESESILSFGSSERRRTRAFLEANTSILEGKQNHPEQNLFHQKTPSGTVFFDDYRRTPSPETLVRRPPPQTTNNQVVMPRANHLLEARCRRCITPDASAISLEQQTAEESMKHTKALITFFASLAVLLSACQPDPVIPQPQGGIWNQSNFDQSDWQ
jgi:hypothetical protein